MELIPNPQTSPVGPSIWLSSAYLPGAIVFVSRFYLTRVPIAGAGHSADESGFPARAETRNWGLGGTAGLRAISEETDRLARDTEMRGRFRLKSTNPSLALAKAITSTSAGIAGALGFPGRAKAPECTLGERSHVRIVNQLSGAWSGHSLGERISVFVVYRVSASARTFRRTAAARA